MQAGFAAGQTDEIAAVPNTPSSPVWTLLDQQVVPEMTRAAPEPVEAKSEEPEVAHVSIVPAAPPESETTTRESRKGWWQRRFKD